MRRAPSVEDCARESKQSRDTASLLLVAEQETYQSRLDVLAERAHRVQVTDDPAGRLRHQMLHGHRPTTPAVQDIRAEALKAEKDGAA